MSGPIPVMPIDTVQAQLGELIGVAKSNKLPMSTHFLLSVSEYLKDAQRWHWMINNSCGYHLNFDASPEELQRAVDEQMGKP
jgi:hypothetical protein